MSRDRITVYKIYKSIQYLGGPEKQRIIISIPTLNLQRHVFGLNDNY